MSDAFDFSRVVEHDKGKAGVIRAPRKRFSES
jgi:hypothetical protein